MRWAFLLAAAIALVSSVEAQSTVAGSTPGSFRVTESGAAEYRIPIQVPPGISGMEPKLALVYNSQGGNGLLGVGWSLEGLSSITRCPRTVAQDGVRGGVNYDWNDRYCLDGQRLMVISGTYGADGAEYRTERESFSKVISYGVAGNGPAWFKVWSKGGQILEYGNTADSRIEAQGKPTVRVWAVNRVSDSKGNHFTVDYTEDNANGEYRPNRLLYTGGASTASVKLVYDARPDVGPSYEAGSLINATQRLTNVQTYSGNSLVSDYRLAYDQGFATGRSRVASLRHCETNGCLPATTFVRQESGSTLTYAGETAIGIGWSADREWIPMDVNGDGRTDLVIRLENGDLYTFLSTGSGLSSPVVTVTGIGAASGRLWFPMDLDGDGRADLVARLDDGLYTFLSNGSGFRSPGYTAAAIAWTSERQWMPMDVNGDGRTDMVIRLENGDLYTLLSTGAGFSSPALTATGIGSATGRLWFPMDVDGDGRTDLVARLDDGLYTFLSNGSTFGSPGYTAAAIGWTSERQWIPMDVNGDGRMDMVIRLENGDLLTFLSTGAGFSSPAGTATGISSATGRLWIPMDVNGDGRSDLFARLDDGLYVFPSNGSTFGPPSYTAAAIGWTSERQWIPMDVNGDGRTDMMIRLENGYLHTLLGPASAPDLVNSVSDGSGATLAVTYQPLTDNSVYTRDAAADAAVYPAADVQAPLNVVAWDTVSGSGTTRSRTHTFGGLKVSHDGRGLLGFRWHEAKHPSSGLVIRTQYSQAWPFAGMPSAVRRTQGSGALLSEVTNTYSCTNPASGTPCTVAAGNRYFPFLSQSVEAANDLNGAALPGMTTTSAYDAYGNASSVLMSGSDGYSKTMTNIYSNDAANWLLGRLTRSTVQSAAP